MNQPFDFSRLQGIGVPPVTAALPEYLAPEPPRALPPGPPPPPAPPQGHTTPAAAPQALSAGPEFSERPWERQARENDREWALFRSYRDDAHPSPQKYVPRELPDFAKRVGIPLPAIQQIARSWAWDWRAGQYDMELDRASTSATMTEREQMTAIQKRRLDKARRLVEGELDKMLARSTTDPNGPGMKAHELATLMKELFQQERLLHGEVTERTATQVSTIDLTKLPLEVLQLMKTHMIDTTGEDVTPPRLPGPPGPHK